MSALNSLSPIAGIDLISIAAYFIILFAVIFALIVITVHSIISTLSHYRFRCLLCRCLNYVCQHIRVREYLVWLLLRVVSDFSELWMRSEIFVPSPVFFRTRCLLI